jgi:WD40 repeat protein
LLGCGHSLATGQEHASIFVDVCSLYKAKVLLIFLVFTSGASKGIQSMLWCTLGMKIDYRPLATNTMAGDARPRAATSATSSDIVEIEALTNNLNQDAALTDRATPAAPAAILVPSAPVVGGPDPSVSVPTHFVAADAAVAGTPAVAVAPAAVSIGRGDDAEMPAPGPAPPLSPQLKTQLPPPPQEHADDKPQQSETEARLHIATVTGGQAARRRRRIPNADAPWAAAADEFFRALPAIITYSEPKRPTPFRDMRGWIETVSGERYKLVWDRFLSQLEPDHVANDRDSDICRHILAKVVTDQVDPHNDEFRQTRQAVSNAIKRELKCHREQGIPGKGTTFRDVFREKCRLWTNQGKPPLLRLQPLGFEARFNNAGGTSGNMLDHELEADEQGHRKQFSSLYGGSARKSLPEVHVQLHDRIRTSGFGAVGPVAAQAAISGAGSLSMLTDAAEADAMALSDYSMPAALQVVNVHGFCKQPPINGEPSALPASETTRNASNEGRASLRGSVSRIVARGTAPMLAPRPAPAPAEHTAIPPVGRVKRLSSSSCLVDLKPRLRKRQSLSDWSATLFERYFPGGTSDGRLDIADVGPSGFLLALLDRNLLSDVFRLLLDFRWIRWHVAYGGGVMGVVMDGYDAFFSDRRDTEHGHLEWESTCELEALRLIRNALVLSNPYLKARHNGSTKDIGNITRAGESTNQDSGSGVLATQLYGRLIGPSIQYAPVATLLQSIREYPTDGGPWMRPLNRCLDEPCADLRVCVHATDATIAEISPDGKLVAAVCAKYPDGVKTTKKLYELRVWRTDSGTEVATLLTDEYMFRSLAFSPNGQWLVTLQFKSANFASQPLKFWRVSTIGVSANSPVIAQCDEEQIISVAVAGNSQEVICACTASNFTSKIMRWDCNSGRMLQSPALRVIGKPETLTLSEDGRYLAYLVLDETKSETKSGNVNKGAAVCIYETSPDPVSGGTVNILCREGSSIHCESERLSFVQGRVHSVLDKDEVIACVAFLGKSVDHIVTSGRKGNESAAHGVVKVWKVDSSFGSGPSDSLPTPGPVLNIREGVTSVTSLVCPSMDAIVCGCDDGHVRVWTLSGNSQNSLHSRDRLSNDETYFILGAGRVQAYPKSDTGLRLQDSSMYVSAAIDGDLIVSTTSDRNVVYVWDFREYRKFTVQLWRDESLFHLAEAYWYVTASEAETDGDCRVLPLDFGYTKESQSNAISEFTSAKPSVLANAYLTCKIPRFATDHAILLFSSTNASSWILPLYFDRKRQVAEEGELPCGLFADHPADNPLYNFSGISGLGSVTGCATAPASRRNERVAVTYDDKFVCWFQLEMPLPVNIEHRAIFDGDGKPDPDLKASRKRLRDGS